jgi:hypothetical protein
MYGLLLTRAPIPNAFLQDPTLAFLGEGLGQLDPDKVYGWLEGGGAGNLGSMESKTEIAISKKGGNDEKIIE